jgi:hypothetical protein
MDDFSIFKNVSNGRFGSVVSWLRWADADTIRPHITSSVLRTELCHCGQNCVNALTHGLYDTLTSHNFPDLSAAFDKESLIFLLYLKARSIHRGFQGSLHPLDVRGNILRIRLEDHSALAVIEAEEQYCQRSLRLAAEEALAWDEYMAVSYPEPLLIAEILAFLLKNAPPTRSIMYKQILGRTLSPHEESLISGYMASQTGFFVNWIDGFLTHLARLGQAPRKEIRDLTRRYLGKVCVSRDDAAPMFTMLKD